MTIKYVTFFNYGYADFAANAIANYLYVLKTATSSLSITAVDESGYDYIKSFLDSIKDDQDISSIELKKNIIGLEREAGFYTPEFRSIVHKKIDIVLEELKANEVIHYFDTDVFFFEDPSQLIAEKLQDNDIVFQQDSPRAHNHDLYSNYVCTGNFSAKRNPRSIALLETVQSKANLRQNDQEVLYTYLNDTCENIRQYKDCTLDVFDPELFQNGFDAFKAEWYLKSNKISVHANHMFGKSTKVESFKKMGAWLLD